MRRFTILSLMWAVVGVAVAIAALRNADDYWAGGLILVVAILIGAVTLGAFYHSGRQRARRLGFAIFGGGYFTLAFLGLSDQYLARLPTTWLLMYIHQQVAPAQTFVVAYTAPVQYGPATTLTSNVTPGPLPNTITTTTTSQYIVGSGVGGAQTSTRWRSLLPGAANYQDFSAVGHSLFALLAGLLGMLLAQRYHAKQELALTTAKSATSASTGNGSADCKSF
jgi:hypothetical protein